MSRGGLIWRWCRPIALLALWLLCACSPAGGPAELPSVDSLPDPCTLLARQEVDALFGQPSDEPYGERELYEVGCNWTAPGGLMLTLELSPAQAQSPAYERRKSFFTQQGAQPLAGLGDEAYHDDEPAAAILTLRGQTLVFVVYRNEALAAAPRSQAALDLARTVLGRIQ